MTAAPAPFRFFPIWVMWMLTVAVPLGFLSTVLMGLNGR